MAVGEVSATLVSLEQLRAREVFGQSWVRKLQQATVNAWLLCQRGMAGYIDVISTQTNSLQREPDLALVKRGALGEAIKLYPALDGGQKPASQF